MKRKTFPADRRYRHLALCLATICLTVVLIAPASGQYWQFPPLPPPHEYGDLLINRISEANQVKPAFFSHWSHRLKYTCRVCHLELDFAFAANTTEITEKANQQGRFCGACHNDKIIFGHTDKHCAKCHTGAKASDRDRFEKLTGMLPHERFGNRINWGKALMNNQIKPVYSIFNNDEKPMKFDKKLELEAEWTYVPPAFFPHDVHVQWLDCANCHPDIFNIKKKTTQHFSMKYILEDKFCGVCHLRVAFPLNNCTRCHPGIKVED